MTPPSEPGDRGLLRLLVAIVLASALAPLNSTMLAVAIPSIAKQFGNADATVTHALVTSYLVASIALQSPGGKLGDVMGHRRALSLGRWIFLGGALLAVVAPNLWVLVAARVATAAGGAVVVPAATALLRTELPEARRGRAFGTFGASMALAAMLGPLVGGALEARFGFRALFLVNVPVLLVSAVLSFQTAAPTSVTAPPTAPARKPVSIDVIGLVLLAASLGALVIGARLRGTLRVEVMIAGAALLVPFAIHERRTRDPIVDLGLFRLPSYSAGAAVIALHNLGMYALLFLIPSLLARLFASASNETGRILVAMTAAMVVASPVAGRLSDRFGARVVMTTGCAIALGGMVLLRASPLTSPTSLLPPLVLLGAGIGLASAPSQAGAMSVAPREKSGVAAGMLSTLRYLGGVVGIVVLALVAHDGTGHGVVDPRAAIDALGELHAATDVFVGALALALLAAFAGGRPTQPATA